MRCSALKAKTRRGFRPCRNPSNRANGVAENLQQQEFSPTAPNRALGHRQIEPEQLLIHTDQGSHKISCSMSAKGWCWDNTGVESFCSTLKHELDLDDDAETRNSPQGS